MITPEQYAEYSAAMDKIFKFKVGDIVQPRALGDYAETPSGYSTETNKRASPDAWHSVSFTSSNNYRYQIIERLLQQCHGGIQKHYDVHLVDSRGLIDTSHRRVIEDEIVLSAPYKAMRGMSKGTFVKWANSLPDDGIGEDD